MSEADPYAPFRETMRRKHGYCGPYRLGIAIGEEGADLPNPYTKAMLANQFDAGRKVGEYLRLRDETQRNIRIAIWNACRECGMGQDLSQALVVRAMDQATMWAAINVLCERRDDLP